MKWTKFSEKWPTDDKFLLYSPEHDCILIVSTCCMARYCSKEYLDSNGSLVDLDIKKDYWMPLPEKPEVIPDKINQCPHCIGISNYDGETVATFRCSLCEHKKVSMNELDDLRKQMRAFIDKHHLTYTEYCMGTKLNPSVLSAFLREAYLSKMLPRTVLRIMKVHRMKVEQYEQ